MTKVVLDHLASLTNQTTAIDTINRNSDALVEAIQKTLSRDGTTPNQMESDLDMNSNSLFNLPAATTATQPVRKKEFDRAVFENVVYDPAPTTEYSSVLEAQSDELSPGLTGVFVHGYYTKGDGGQAYWKKVSSEPTHTLKFSGTDEDGNTVWFEYGETLINVRALGCKPDGVTGCGDILVGIGKAMGAGLWQALYFPVGEYLMDTNFFDIDGAPDSVIIYGDGQNLSKIILPEGSGGRPFTVRNVDGVVVRGLHFYNSATTPTDCLNVLNSSRVLIEENWIDNAGRYGLGIYEDAILIPTTDVTNSGTHTAHYGLNFATTHTVTFSTSTVDGITYLSADWGTAHGLGYTDEVYFTTTGSLPSPLVADTIYTANFRSTNSLFLTKQAQPCDDVIVRHNYFTNCGSFGFEHFPKKKSNRGEVYGNHFKHCGHNEKNISGQTPADAASMKPCSGYHYALIHDNIIEDSGGGGIYVGLYDYKEVYNNFLHNCRAGAISVTQYDQLSYSGTYQPDNVMSWDYMYVHDNVCYYDDSFDNDYAGFGGVALNKNTIGPIVWQGNVVRGGSNSSPTFKVQTIAGPKGLYFIDNTIYDGAAQVIYYNKNSGEAPIKPVIAGNRFINTDLTAAIAARIDIEDCVSPVIINNYWENAGTFAISLVDNTGVVTVEGNTFNGYNVSNASSVAVINVNDSATTIYNIRNNRLLTNSGNLKAWLGCNSTNPTFVCANNIADSLSAIPYVGSLTFDNGVRPLMSLAGRRWFSGSAAPTTGGPYVVGDIVWNSGPTAAGTPGWICTAVGSPGTWVTLGTLGS